MSDDLGDSLALFAAMVLVPDVVTRNNGVLTGLVSAAMGGRHNAVGVDDGTSTSEAGTDLEPDHVGELTTGSWGTTNNHTFDGLEKLFLEGG
jgi:hypothetical protein